MIIQHPARVYSFEKAGWIGGCRHPDTVQVENDNPFGLVDYENQRSRILNAGLEVYECMNEQLVHTKAVLVDENICILGSYNPNMRSTYLDTETMLVIDSPQLKAYLREELTQVTASPSIPENPLFSRAPRQPSFGMPMK